MRFKDLRLSLLSFRSRLDIFARREKILSGELFFDDECVVVVVINGGDDCFGVDDLFRLGENAPWMPVMFAKDFRKRFTRDSRFFSKEVGDVLFLGDGVNPNFLRR